MGKSPERLQKMAESKNDSLSPFLRVGFVHYPPAVFNTCSHFPELANKRSCPYPGHCVEIVRLIAKRLDLQVVPVVLSTGEINVGSLGEDGRWRGVLGAIANGTVDTACIFYQETQLRLRDFDFSDGIYTTMPRIAVRDQNSLPFAEMWKLFQPYTVNTWLVIVVQLALLMAIFALIERTECRMGMKKRQPESEQNQIQTQEKCKFRPFRVAWNLLAMQLLKPGQTQFRSVAGKFLLIVFGLFQCVLITSIYQSWIVSSLVQLNTPSPIKNARSFVDDIRVGKYRFVSQYKGHWFYESLKYSPAFPFKEMREAVERNPIREAHSIQESLELVERYGNVLFVQGDDPAYFLASSFCDIVFVERDFAHMSAHLVFAKGSPLTPLVNRAIELEKFTIIRLIYERYRNLRGLVHNQECGEREKLQRWYKPLALAPMAGLMTVFATGMTIALLAFMVERSLAMKLSVSAATVEGE